MKYKDAIRSALVLAMRNNPNVFVMGLGVADPKGVFGSTLGLVNEFGTDRVFDIPLSENAIVGVAIGASMQGMRPVMVNQRIDFLWLALDQIANHAAKWRRMFNDAQTVPIVVRAIVGRGWGQGGQHSQALHERRQPPTAHVVDHSNGKRSERYAVRAPTMHDVHGLRIGNDACKSVA